MDVTLTGSERIQLLQVLPQKVRSLRESVQLNGLREKVSLDQEESEALGATEDGRFNPQFLDRVEDREFALTDGEADLIGYVFVQLEQKEEVPASPAFVSLIQKFEDPIQQAKGDE
jgi:hypothetical protein